MVIDRNLMEDERLSYCAKGLWHYLSNLSQDLIFDQKDLIQSPSEDEETIEKSMKELEKFGYLTRDEDRFILCDKPKKKEKL